MMRKQLVPSLALVLALAATQSLTAQRPERSPRAPGREPAAAARPADSASVNVPAVPEHVTTHHSAVIGGQRIDYDATVGNIILKDSEGQPEAAIYYTAYIRRGVRDETARPVAFTYNGGPGSASIWLHMGAFGPKRVNIPDAEHAPPPPYPVVDNQYSPLDVTDLVFIDPVGTGFSRPLGKATGVQFWGVDEDVRSLSRFITRWLSDNGRWNSPRYLMGESYGTTRSAALVNYMQQEANTDFNGVILISSVLDFGTIRFSPGNPMPYILYLPSYAAVAWYHKALPVQPPDLRAFLHEVEHFATTEYAQALFAGTRLDPATRTSVLDKLHRYTGLSTEYLDRADLRVDNSQFEKELMRQHGIAIGRLDARYTGPTMAPLAERVDYDPQSADISSAYASAWNDYLHNDLGFGRDKDYVVSGNVRPWNWTHTEPGRGGAGGLGGWPSYTNVATDLSQALQYNTHLQVLQNSGLFDLATPYYATEFTLDHLGLPPELRGHVRIAEYDAGHMMYVSPQALAKLKQNIAQFIASTSGSGAAARVAAGGRASTGGAGQAGGR